jgi:diaminohydroxyphosphoribosylaminopyrimidine deaminase/5-amino-6-(5-phosphoribosylamino)uracil reductase
MVGAVVVAADGRIVGRGWHQQFGGPHAELLALREAGDAARGATLYVTLEPCCHHGKTPPCTDAVIAAGVGRVVAAMSDLFPQVAGRGLKQIAEAGIRVECGLLEARARALNAPFIKLVTTGLPYVIAKWAMSLDGKIATRTGESRWISSEVSRRRVHELRNVVDAVIIGLGTAIRDDPELTCRIDGGRNPRRIVVDGQAELPLESKLVRTAGEIPTLVAATESAPADRATALQAAACEVLRLPGSGGMVHLEPLMRLLGERRLTNVLVEGGGELLGQMVAGGLVDRVMVFVAPKLIGGRAAPSPLAGEGIASLAEALSLVNVRVEQVGPDILVEGEIAQTR